MQKDFNKNIKNSDLDCDICKDMLYDYVSDNLSTENKTAVEKHIGLCPRCAEELTEVKGLISMLNGFEEVPVPKDLELSLNKALEETANEIKIKNKRLRFRRVTSAIVPFAAAAVLAIGLYSGGAFDKYINSDSIFDGQSTYTEQGESNNADNPENFENVDKGENANGASDSEKAEKVEKYEKYENFTDKNKKTDNKNKGAVSEKDDNKKSDNVKSDSKKSDNYSSKSQVSDKSNDSNTNKSNISENNGRDTDKPANTGNADNVNNTESAEQVYGTASQNNEEDAKTAEGVSSGGGSGRVRGGVTDDAESQPAVVTYGLDDLGDESTDVAADKSDNSEKPNNSDKSENSKNIGEMVPASCEIVTSNPEAYASLGLSIDGGSISYTLWESIRTIAVSTGDTLNAYDFADASVNSTISVTLIKK